MTAKEIIEKKIAGKLKENSDAVKEIGAVIAINLTGDGGGRWVIDCVKNPPEIREDKTSEVEMTINMNTLDMEKMVTGELNPQTAFLTGKVKVDGNLSLALKLGQLLM